MKSSILRGFSPVVLVSAVLALSGAPAAASRPAEPADQAPLSVTVTCSGTQCMAGAHGGSGTYVSFDWSSSVVELWEMGRTSEADASPSCGPGHMVSVDVFVTDSNGAVAHGGTWAFCP